MNSGVLLLGIALGAAIGVFVMLWALLWAEGERYDSEYIDVEVEP